MDDVTTTTRSWMGDWIWQLVFCLILTVKIHIKKYIEYAIYVSKIYCLGVESFRNGDGGQPYSFPMPQIIFFFFFLKLKSQLSVISKRHLTLRKGVRPKCFCFCGFPYFIVLQSFIFQIKLNVKSCATKNYELMLNKNVNRQIKV